MMKKNLLALALISSVAIAAEIQKPAASPVQKDKKLTDIAADTDLSTLNIRFIESFSVMRNCSQGVEAGKKLDSKREQLGKEIQKDEQKMSQALNEFQSKATTLSEAAREKEEKNLRRMKTDYEAKVQESKYEMELAMQKTTEELAKDMEAAVTEVAKRDKLDAVVDSITGRVIYVKENLNITGQVVKEMNVKNEQKLAQNKSAAKPGLKVASR
jgi:outer membrane protein